MTKTGKFKLTAMKKLIFLLLFLTVFSSNLFAQGQAETEREPRIMVELGVMYLLNLLNEDPYFQFRYNPAWIYHGQELGGLNLKFTMPTRHEFLDVIGGAMFMNAIALGQGERILGWPGPGLVNIQDHVINGGGVYFGISPKLGGRVFGFTSDLAIGVFSFKEYVAIVNNMTEPFVDIHSTKASHGLGAKCSIGMYLRIGRFGINPTILAIFSGGSGASFTFYGVNLPITFQF